MANDQAERTLDISAKSKVNVLIRFAFYAFIVSIPFETAGLELFSTVGTISMMIGIAFAGVALLQPRTCFNSPPGAFWCFAGYVFAYIILGATQNLEYAGPMLERFLTLIQMLVLLWISYNLFKDPEICQGALMALVASCVVLSLFQIFGIATVEYGRGRSSVFASGANSVGAILSIGLLALVGVTYGRSTVEKRMVLFAWTLFPVIGTAIMMTGSRGSLLSLILGLALLIMKDGRLRTKFAIGSVVVLAIGFLVWSAVTDETMRTRLENTIYEGDVATRDQIIPQTWAMFLEKPVLGWGPVSSSLELGHRRGYPKQDAHNVYLYVLTETGLFGALPFFAGLWLSLKAAWGARSGREGAVPMALFAYLLIFNISGTWHHRKLFWLIIAYVLASAWSARKASQYLPVQFPDPLKLKAPGSGTFSSFSQSTNVQAVTTSTRKQGPA